MSNTVQNKEKSVLDSTEKVEWYISSQLASLIFAPKLNGRELKPAFHMRRIIRLSAPVMNPWYMSGENQDAEKALGMTAKEIRSVATYARFVVVRSSVPDVAPGMLFDHKETAALSEEHKGSITFGIGAEGLASYAKEKGVILPGILTSIPLVLPSMPDKDDKDREEVNDARSDIQFLYSRLIMRNDRVKELLDMGIPSIVAYNEKRILQEQVNDLFENGIFGNPVTYKDGETCISLSYLIGEEA